MKKRPFGIRAAQIIDPEKLEKIRLDRTIRGIPDNRSPPNSTGRGGAPRGSRCWWRSRSATASSAARVADLRPNATVGGVRVSVTQDRTRADQGAGSDQRLAILGIPQPSAREVGHEQASKSEEGIAHRGGPRCSRLSKIAWRFCKKQLIT